MRSRPASIVFISGITTVLLWVGAGPADARSSAKGPSSKSTPQPSVLQRTERKTTAILVDKKKNELHVSEYHDGSYRILKTYHATLGKVQGDKEQEGDLKTPEGIYTFDRKILPPSLKPKFGAMAFYVNYPNTYDQLAGRTGFSIMLHGTNEPQRLKQDYDSEGCVVVRNEEIAEIQHSIRIGLTPILIFPELTAEDLNPGGAAGKSPSLKQFFETWVRSWENKRLDDYIDLYHSDFSAQGKNRAQWKAYKGSLNERYTSIEIGPEDVKYYRHPKYSMVTFTQNYRSRVRGGGWGHRSRGTKILYIAEEAGKPKIIAETYTTLMW
jgi:murein L,D-transpeptidase YafK